MSVGTAYQLSVDGMNIIDMTVLEIDRERLTRRTNPHFCCIGPQLFLSISSLTVQ